MKNLKLLYCLKSNINISDNAKLILDSNGTKNLTYLYTNDGIAVCDIEKNSAELLYGLMEIADCEHLALSNDICAASKFGEVILINPSTKEAQEVTFCDGGIKRMSWSPDQEIVTFVTGSNMVVVMTCTFDVISESSLDDLNFGDQEFITVGWGKKETQFHGSEGKQAAKQKSDFVVPTNVDELDKSINISWRGDSEYFAVSFVGVTGRMFKVFNKEGKLQFTSEKINSLGTPISWKPSGSWIAVPHSLPNKYTIALFEKNGLRHRELILPFKHDEEVVVNINWSTDSDILAIETIKEEKSNLYLYTICNYHWYLKQYLQFESKIGNYLWDLGVKESKTLHVLLIDGSYFKYKWIFNVDHSCGEDKDDQAIVSVIDGKNLLITDFRNNIIPPPMSSYILEMPNFINQCGFIRDIKDTKHCNKFFLITSDNYISFYDLEYKPFATRHKIKSTSLDVCAKINTENTKVPLSKSHWIWINSDSVIYCETKETFSILYLANLKGNFLEISSKVQMDSLIGNVSYENSDNCIVQLINGKVLVIKLNKQMNFEEPIIISEISDICEKIQAINIQNNLKLVTLQSNRNLFLDSTKISSDVTSFFVTKKYLVFTLLSSIKFMSLSNNSIVDERKMERGGKIIIIVPCDSRLILQMPRGNLEAINPRVLSLDIVGDYLNSLDYGKAMDMLRKQRINLNIIFDHNPKLFLDNINRFLDEISNPNWLNLFLSDLQNEDFTRTMYSGNYINVNNNYPDGYSVDNKINYICEKMCNHMEKKDFQQYLLPIITTYVKIGNLEKALDIIWTEKENEEKSNIDGNNMVQKNAENALNYILYMVDVNELFNVALGMYNFGLVLLVGTRSQKDPREYIPFLIELRKYEENYRRFKIDEHLKRYDKALEHLAKSEGDHYQETIQFVQKHKMYQKALLAFKENINVYKEIALLFGDFLRAEGKHENASIMYERGGDLNQAILSAKHVLDWQRCLMLTSVLTNGDLEELKNVSLSLITALQEKGKFEEAWFLLKTYVGDFTRSLECLLKGRHYLKAIFEAKMIDRKLIESLITPHIKDYENILYANLESDRELFIKYKTRLLIVRKQRNEKESDNFYDDGIDECDLLSDTSSIKSSNYTSSSRRTGKTFRSSKNRRKHERKLLSLKEGNPFEDIALIDALHNLILKISDQQFHIRETCKALLEVFCDEEAKKIQKIFRNLLLLIKDSLDEIWIPEMITSQQLMGPKIDYAQLQNNQRYAMINPQKRYKPQMNLTDWEHEILK